MSSTTTLTTSDAARILSLPNKSTISLVPSTHSLNQFPDNPDTEFVKLTDSETGAKSTTGSLVQEYINRPTSNFRFLSEGEFHITDAEGAFVQGFAGDEDLEDSGNSLQYPLLVEKLIAAPAIPEPFATTASESVRCTPFVQLVLTVDDPKFRMNELSAFVHNAIQHPISVKTSLDPAKASEIASARCADIIAGSQDSLMPITRIESAPGEMMGWVSKPEVLDHKATIYGKGHIRSDLPAKVSLQSGIRIQWIRKETERAGDEDEVTDDTSEQTQAIRELRHMLMFQQGSGQGQKN